ncbi:MAG: GGDEF domain-containing protein [Candidatus Omnitrophica bacterium]|nr:GGDEF domain-containing protein [Candidatus Omnitrophota bacterium]
MRFSKLEEEGIKASDLIKRSLFIFFSILIILAGLTAILYISSARNELSIVENQELKNISTVSKLVIRSFDSTISDVLFLAELASNYISKKEEQKKFFEAASPFLKNKDYYKRILLADERGRVLFEIKTEDKLLKIIHSPNEKFWDNVNFRNTLEMGHSHVYISDFQLVGGIAMLVFGTPVFDRYKNRKAVLLLYYDCRPIFDILGTTFESQTERKSHRIASYFIVDKDGYWIKGPKPEDEFGFLYPSRSDKRLGNIYPEAWEKISKDQTGQILTIYGLFTFTSFYPLARAEKISEQSALEFDSITHGRIRSFDYVWKIISFVPKNLCTIQSITRLKEFLLYDSILLLFFIVVSWIIARITLKKEYAEKILELLTVTDTLTGLYNRRGFFLLAEQQLKIASRVNQHMALFFMDLDEFKSINDNYGHNEGDFALVKAAEVLKSTFRQSDIVARIGGDEFVALVIQDSPVDTETIMERLNEGFALLNSAIEKKYKLFVSIGFAFYKPEQNMTIDHLISIADRMMYENKHKKKKLT